MAPQDRRHSIAVARCVAAADPSREVVAGALLHDVGKTVSGLNTFERVAATVVGPRSERFRHYHDHERIGSEMAEQAGSDPVTVALVRGEGPAVDVLRTCDDV
jgi:putative nucleotidyltransferase with HDIG domain